MKTTNMIVNKNIEDGLFAAAKEADGSELHRFPNSEGK
jgi:hypothetical protein